MTDIGLKHGAQMRLSEDSIASGRKTANSWTARVTGLLPNRGNSLVTVGHEGYGQCDELLPRVGPLAGGIVAERRRKRIWVQNVAVSVHILQTRVNVAAARGLAPDQEATAVGISELLVRARDAALRDDPRPSRWANWWRGTLVDSAYQNLHAARAQMVDLYDEAELVGEAPSALARAQDTIHRDDPRRLTSDDLAAMPIEQRRALLRRTIEDSYDALDRRHERLRSFRNIVLMVAVLVALLVGATIWVVAANPTMMPLCFDKVTATGAPGPGTRLNCPSGSDVSAPSSGDILIVALVGALGGALAATVSIRNLRGTSTPYDVPVALAWLKFPLGAFTAILGLVAIRGEFIPGLSVLDSQQQILAYALLLGFAQQVFTRLLDKKAQDLMNGLPAKDAVTPPAAGSTPPGPTPIPTEEGPETEKTPGTEAAPAAETAEAADVATAEADEAAAQAAEAAEAEAAEAVMGARRDDGEESAPDATLAAQGVQVADTLDNPDGDDEEQGEQIQDDESGVLPNVPETDHR
jgi:hypothetical protein